MHSNQELISSSQSFNLHGDQDEFAETAAKLSHDFNAQLKLENSRLPDVKTSVDVRDQQETQSDHTKDEREDEEEEDEDEDENENDDGDDDFTFILTGDDTSPIAADKVFQDGQIRPIFPLFNQDLIYANDNLENRLPIRPPVDKVFIESPRRPSSSSSSESDEIDRVAAGPYCSWSKEATPEVCKKSNSTGFSKLWRFREKVNRSNSDGRDAFVFLNGSTTKKSVAKSEASSEKKMASERSLEKKTVQGASSKVKVNIAGGKVKKGGKAKMSAHEVYLKNKGLTEEDKRRSYLPYRPELMGFFTNVNGGLSRNVHPF